MNEYMTIQDIINIYARLRNIGFSLGVESTRIDIECFKYIRSQRYNDVYWNTLCGEVDNSFERECDKYEYDWIKTCETIEVAGNIKLDVVHLFANLNGFLVNKGDVTGWAGDIVQYAKNLNDKFPGDGMSQEDITADIDAYNIYHSEGFNIYEKFVNYYKNYSTKRTSLFIKDEDIVERYNNSLDKEELKTLQQALLVSDDNIIEALNRFDRYLNSSLSINSSKYKINISVDSQVYKLLGSKQIQILLERNKDYKKNVNITESMFTNELTENDLLIVDNVYANIANGFKKQLWSYTRDEDKNKYDYYLEDIDLQEELYKGIKCYKLYTESVVPEYIPCNNFTKIETFIAVPNSNIGDTYIHNIYYRNVNEYNAFTGSELTSVEFSKLKESEKIYKSVEYTIEPLKNYYAMVPFYVVGYADEEGSWETNVMIKTGEDNEEILNTYCPITVGGTFVDNCEELVINGQNFGIKLPKDIIKAVYQGNYYSEYLNERLYNDKLKEYLLNYNIFKGECGNFKSAIDGLKWFGYGDKLELYKLLQNDNKFQNQYIRDNFDIFTDVISTYKTFRNSTLLALALKENQEIDEDNTIDFESEWFIGEGKPKLESLFDKSIEVRYDEQDIAFYKPYYDYTFDELGLKLFMLKYYYQNYFLPIHLTLNSVSIQHQVHMNDIKLIQRSSTQITEHPVLIQNNDIIVKFPNTHTQYFNNQVHYIDSNYNEFDNTKWVGENTDEDIFYINDTCISVPILFNTVNRVEVEKDNKGKFIYNGEDVTSVVYSSNGKYLYDIPKKEQYYDCHLLLTKKNSFNEPQYIMKETNLTYIENHPRKAYYWYNEDTNTYQKSTYAKVKEYLYIPVEYDYLVEHFDDYLWYEFDVKSNTYKYKSEGEFDVETQWYKKIKPTWYYCDKVLKDTTETLIHESHFSFCQTYNPEYYDFNHGMFNENCNYYRNFVIHPKTINTIKTGSQEKFDITYWLDAEYTISLCVNGKWFYYDFITKIPELDIQYAKLEYKYWLCHEDTTLFKQITSIEDDKINFNTFMWQPGLVTVNNTDYIEDIVNYAKIHNVKTVNGETFSFDPLCYKVVADNGNFIVSTKSKYILKEAENNEYDIIEVEDGYVEELLNSGVEYKLLHNLNEYVQKYYTETPNFVDDKYLNKRHLVRIYKNGEEWKYDSLENEVDIYRQFFENNGDVKPLFRNSILYDFYLMHDNEVWYGMFISKKTINEFSIYDKNFNIIGFEEDEYKKMSYTYSDYKFVYDRSDTQLLINRLQWKPTNGINHFNRKDIIVFTLVNNDRLPFKLTLGSKWHITPLSIGMNDSAEVNSNTEIAIVSIGDENFNYERGYFNVVCRYSLDDYIQHNYEKRGQFRVN